MQSTVSRILYPGIARQLRNARPEVSYRLVIGVPAVIAIGLAAYALVRLTGGSPNTLNHLGYAPIILAAYLFGLRGAVPAALASGVLLGPAAALVPGQAETFDSWFPRSGMLLAVGLVVGGLFDLAQRSIDRWQAAAVEVAEQQRMGMIALARGAEAKDTDTGDHIVRVQLASAVLAEATGVSEEAASAIGWSAMLHDVGKLHVPDAILLKPGPLTAEEWELMRRHTTFGEQILRDGAAFEMARRIARWHHENIDGSGYPDGLRGEQIPFEARIVRVADAFDAMTHDRPYKRAISLDAAIDELQRCAGSQFDPELVRLFVQRLQADPSIVTRLAAHQLP
jgi:hypothetical protein